MLETDSVIIIALLCILVCTQMKEGLAQKPKSFKFSSSTPARIKYGDLKVECDQYPSYSRSQAPDKLRVPCGATAVRKLVDSSRDETYGQEGFVKDKEEWDSDMVSNLFTRTAGAASVIHDVDNMAARGPTAQRRNQVEESDRVRYN